MWYKLADHLRNLLDFSNEAVIEKCATHLMDLYAPKYSLCWGNHMLLFGAGWLMLGMLTLAHHTMLDIGCIPAALQSGLIFRLSSSYKSIWSTYMKVIPCNMVYDFEDSHQIVTPGIDLPVAQVRLGAQEVKTPLAKKRGVGKKKRRL